MLHFKNPNISSLPSEPWTCSTKIAAFSVLPILDQASAILWKEPTYVLKRNRNSTYIGQKEILCMILFNAFHNILVRNLLKCFKISYKYEYCNCFHWTKQMTPDLLIFLPTMEGIKSQCLLNALVILCESQISLNRLDTWQVKKITWKPQPVALE